MEAELDVHKMREQVAKSQINTENPDDLALAGPSDREQQQHHGGGVGPDLLVGPDGKPVMLRTIRRGPLTLHVCDLGATILKWHGAVSV